MKRLLAMILMVVLSAGLAWQAQASGAYGKYLPPNKAFQLKAYPRAQSVVLDWQIADGYYLYRNKFKVKAKNGAIGKVSFPPGKFKQDPNFGRVEIYYREVRASVPIKKRPNDGKMTLAVTYQGCAEGGICYPPIIRQVQVQLGSRQAAAVGGVRAASAGGSGGGAGSETIQNAQNHLAMLVERANPLWFVAVFFVLGVLLSFTPCVLPMVPILAGILGRTGSRVNTRRGFLLSVVYVLAMASVYTVAGVIAGFVGVGLQGFFQAPWVIGLFAAIFVALALSLFDVYEFRLPAFVTNHLAEVSGEVRGGTLPGAAGMGALAALIVSPCVAAPIAGALIAIGQAGSPVRGGIALAALSLGMGAPLIVYGTVAGRLLPKAGRWMVVIERLLGIAMLVYAVWLVGRVVPGPVVLVLWGLTGILVPVVLGAFKRPIFAFDRLFIRGVGVLAGVAGLVLIVGGVAGGTNPLAPLAGFHETAKAQMAEQDYRPVDSLSAVKLQLARAEQAGQPVMIEFRADWCTDCLNMEHTTLHNPAVRMALRHFRILQVDVTGNTPADRALLKHFGLYGPPAYLFFSREGQRLTQASVVGFMAAKPFLGRLDLALAASRARGSGNDMPG